MPSWLEKIIVNLILKQLTPEAIAAAEKAAAEFVVCKLKELAATTESKIDDEIVARVAEGLGVDCAA